jgi:hypothetical protein
MDLAMDLAMDLDVDMAMDLDVDMAMDMNPDLDQDLDLGIEGICMEAGCRAVEKSGNPYRAIECLDAVLLGSASEISGFRREMNTLLVTGFGCWGGLEPREDCND